jgi:mRNA interferase MazF
MSLSPGDLVSVLLNPSEGSEQKGLRPCVVISPKSLNENLSICTVIPLTTSLKNWPTRVETNLDGVEGQAAVEQIRTISQGRIKKKKGSVPQNILDEIRLVIRQTFTEP